jgi:phosphoribosylaminoimidazolecarboxamide formyltransferase/IMP cyclohydrolase
MNQRRRALLSVSNKTGIEEFGRALVDRGFELLSTGGTAAALAKAGLPVTKVSAVTGHPEILDGRVKTLHPAIHGPLLARRDKDEDLEALESLGYGLIDIVAVNLYPFRETIARGGVTVADAMEQVDIGGPTMIRAAAKNHAHVFVVVAPEDYAPVLDAVDGKLAAADVVSLRRRLGAAVFRHISSYDEAVASFLEDPAEGSGAGAVNAGVVGEGTAGALDEAGVGILPATLNPSFERKAVLRYGENPDQEAALYLPAGVPRGIAALEQRHGKELSYNNLLDLDGALLSLSPFALSPRPAVVIVKHTTPSGIGVGDTVVEAYRKALSCDPVSAFGGILAVNRVVDEAAAQAMSELFVECITAPGFTPEAFEVLSRKKNVRILTYPSVGLTGIGGRLQSMEGEGAAIEKALERVPEDARGAAAFLALHGQDPEGPVLRGVYGGVLAQSAPRPPFFGVEDTRWQTVTSRAPTSAEQEDLAFAWAGVFGVKSNAILLARSGGTLGIGAGQMSRVDSSRIAVWKAAEAGLPLAGAALASDAFFPFRDGVDAAAQAGIRAIIQPGGSVRDDEVIAAANEHGIAMVFTSRRLFRH